MTYFKNDFITQLNEMGRTPRVEVLTTLGEDFELVRIISLSESIATFEIYPANGVSNKEKECRKSLGNDVVWDRISIPYHVIARVFFTVEEADDSIGFQSR